ncbi:MAG: (2Fe-2S)-binding protein [Casimicrobiaceae bacterium]|nr:(2Fe-2S)-binding protein [Casimicrobiaceae bacterium]
MIVCVCHGINERTLKEAVQQGVATFPELQATTGVATCCGRCADCARCVMHEALATVALKAA